MKLMLTSGGVTNASIHSALLRLLGKPVTESRALCAPTAQWGHPMCNPTSVQGFTAAGSRWRHSFGLGWASLGVLELTALPTIGPDRWVPWVQEADVLLVDGGDATYLHHWMRESGLADLLPSLTDTVWVGISAGSMVMTPRIGPDFVEWLAAPDERTLGVVDFSIFPHLEAFPTDTIVSRRTMGCDHRRARLRHRRTNRHHGRRRARRRRLGRPPDQVRGTQRLTLALPTPPTPEAPSRGASYRPAGRVGVQAYRRWLSEAPTTLRRHGEFGVRVRFNSARRRRSARSLSLLVRVAASVNVSLD